MKFTKGQACITVSPTDDGTPYVLQADSAYGPDDEYTVPRYPTKLDRKAQKWIKQGYKLYHFFGKNSGEFFLIGFKVEG